MLGRTVGECQETMTRRERNQWIHYADLVKNEHAKEDYYYAQIAHQISLLPYMFGGTPKLKMKDFLIKFVVTEQSLIEQMSATEREEYLREKGKESRSRWEAIVSNAKTVKRKPRKSKPVAKKGKKDGSQRTDDSTESQS